MRGAKRSYRFAATFGCAGVCAGRVFHVRRVSRSSSKAVTRMTDACRVVTVSQSTLEIAGQTLRSGVVAANFSELPAGVPLCATTAMGDCTLTDCDAVADAPPDGGVVGAGTLTITGLADGGLTLMGGPSGYFQSVTGPVFAAAAVLSVAASGGPVPAFTAPGCPQGTCPAFSRAAWLPVSWTGGTGTIAVTVVVGRAQVLCQFPASSGTGLVPAVALASLPGGLGVAHVQHTERHQRAGRALPGDRDGQRAEGLPDDGGSMRRRLRRGDRAEGSIGRW
jgi:hypothetical protein